MENNHVAKKYVENDEFNRYWIAYKWCAAKNKKFSCGCGSVLEPRFYTEDIRNADITLLAGRLASHINTVKHRNSIGKQIEYNEHLVKRFKKEVFYDEHDNWEKETYTEFEEYEKQHQQYIETIKQDEKYKKWLEKQKKKVENVS